ncbi:hypothetical protein OTU49_000885 [Cherax quadricarinatus]|uniref:Uncharacterized protein n=1 Tax=Cherax quadricarinatus TaxID=27406 RepID=A0AAW0XJ78_CHEQU
MLEKLKSARTYSKGLNKSTRLCVILCLIFATILPVFLLWHKCATEHVIPDSELDTGVWTNIDDSLDPGASNNTGVSNGVGDNSSGAEVGARISTGSSNGTGASTDCTFWARAREHYVLF